MLRKWPFATFSAILVSVGLAFFGTQEGLVWERGLESDIWRWVSASFTHYSPIHLLGNTLALILIGITAEKATSSRFALLVYVAALLVPMAFLYLALPDVQQFAGSSCLAYAMSGVLVITWWPQWKFGAIALVIGILSFQLARFQNIDTNEAHPVWQMHIVAMLVGAGLSAASRRGVKQ